MGKETFIISYSSWTNCIIIGSRSINISAKSIGVDVGWLILPNGVGDYRSWISTIEGSCSDWSSPNVLSWYGIVFLECSWDCYVWQFDCGPGCGKRTIRVIVVHCEVHLGVSVWEDHLIHDQRIVGLGWGGLKTSNCECWEDLSIGSETGSWKSLRIGCLCNIGDRHSQANDAWGDTWNNWVAAGEVLSRYEGD